MLTPIQRHACTSQVLIKRFQDRSASTSSFSASCSWTPKARKRASTPSNSVARRKHHESKTDREKAANRAHADKELERRKKEGELRDRMQKSCGMEFCACTKIDIFQAAVSKLDMADEVRSLVQDTPRNGDPYHASRVLEQIRRLTEGMDSTSIMGHEMRTSCSDNQSPRRWLR